MEQRIRGTSRRDPWNKGQLAGQKTPFKLKDICAIRVSLQLAARTPDTFWNSVIPVTHGPVNSEPESCFHHFGQYRA